MHTAEQRRRCPPIHFSPANSPLHKSYRQLLRRAAASSARRRERQKRKAATSGKAQGEPASAHVDHIHSRHFVAELLSRAATASSTGSSHKSSPKIPSGGIQARPLSSNVLDAPLTPANPASPSATGPTLHDLKKNRELHDVCSDLQQVSICFEELIRNISFPRVETGRVLWNLQSTYISLFERLVAALWKGHMKSAEIVEEKHMAEDGEIDLLLEDTRHAGQAGRSGSGKVWA